MYQQITFVKMAWRVLNCVVQRISFIKHVKALVFLKSYKPKFLKAVFNFKSIQRTFNIKGCNKIDTLTQN